MSDWSSSFDLLTRATGAASTTGTTPSKVDDTYYTNENYTGEPREKVKDNSTLTFEDMLLLMVTQLQNQTIDNQADTNDMMNQLIQMTVMQAMTEMSTQVEELTQANVMSYAASLVGKEVTVGVYNEETKKIDEIVGTVTATGIYDGMNVIFIGDKSYTLSSVMAVGRLPSKPDTEDPDGTENPDDVEKPDDTENPDGVEGGGGAPDAGDENKPVEGTGGDQENPDNTGDTTTDSGTEAAGESIGATEGI